MASSAMEDTALIVVDVQEDFCPPVGFLAPKMGQNPANREQNGALAVQDGRNVASVINVLLGLPFKIKIATQDYHPSNHISFASQHKDAQPFTSTHAITNPEASDSNTAESLQITLWPDHCVQGTPGCEFIPELNLSLVDRVVRKGEDARVEAYSGFGPDFRKPAIAMTGMADLLRENGINKVVVCGIALDYCVKCTAIDSATEGFETIVVEDGTKAVDQGESARLRVRDELDAHGVRLLQSTSREIRAFLGLSDRGIAL